MLSLWRYLAAIFCIVFAATLGATAALASESYVLDVEFSPDTSSLSGKAMITLSDKAPDDRTVTFYLHGELRVDAIRIDGAEVEFTETPVYYSYEYSLVAQKVEFTAPESLKSLDGAKISVEYSGPFHRSRARSPSDYMHIDSDGVFLRSYAYSLWFPVFIEADTDGEAVDFERASLRTPEEFLAVFAGDLISEEKSNGKRTTVWKTHDLPIYAAQATARPYKAMRSHYVDIYTLKDEQSLAGAKKITDYVKQLIDIYNDAYGEPRTKSKTIVAQLPEYGDIASGNMIGISDHIWREFDGSASYGQAIAHELVHDFVYVNIPIDDPFYAMAREGFPDYFFIPAFAQMYGEAAYDDYMDRVEYGYEIKLKTGKDWRGGDIPPQIPLTEINDDNMPLYKDTFVLGDRSRLFFDYLRRKMGADRFKSFIRGIVAKRSITLAEFYAALNAERPDLTDDARIWLETTEFPDRFKRSAD